MHAARNSPSILTRAGKATILFNMTLICLGILYYAIPVYTPLWDVHGFLIITTFTWNIIVVLSIKGHINKRVQSGRVVSEFSYTYLVVFSILMLLSMFGNFLLSTSLPERGVDFTTALVLVVGGNFGIPILGTLLGVLIGWHAPHSPSTAPETVVTGPPSNKARGFQRFNYFMMKATAYILLVGSGPVIIYFIFTPATNMDTLMFGVFVPQLAGFVGFMYLALTAILLLTKNRRKNKISFPLVMTIGIVMSGACFLPLLSTPLMRQDASVEFATAFGADWPSRIDPAANASCKPRSVYPNTT
jgi:hypothetical protein